MKLSPTLRSQGEANVRNAISAIDGARARLDAAWAKREGAPPAAVPPPAAGVAPTRPPLRRVLAESVFYPAHKKRTESKEYRRIRRRLVIKEDRPCLVCGVRNSTLGDPAEDRFGATQIETHHRIVEWALSNAVDLAKFNARVIHGLRRHFPAKVRYQADFTEEQMLAWIDHDPDNLWVLCDVHHRHKYVGIHAISGPIWGPQDILEAGFGPQMAGDVPGHG